MDRKAAERRLIMVCVNTVVIAILAYLILHFFPSVRAGITLTIFGIGLIVFAWTGSRVGIAVWKVFPVTRSEQPGFFWVLIFFDFITGVALIVLGWVIQINIVNAPPPANPLPPDHPDYELFLLVDPSDQLDLVQHISYSPLPLTLSTEPRSDLRRPA